MMDPTVSVLLPIGTAVLGWFLASLWQWWQTKRATEKENYYRVLERTEEIIDRCHEMSDYLYRFFKQSKNSVNRGKAVSADEIDDFTTEFQMRLAKVYVSQRLFFPGIKFETRLISGKADELVQNICAMNELGLNLSSNPDPQAEVDRLNFGNKAVIDSIVTEIALIENMMVKSLNKKAARLGIKSEPVKVDRDRLLQNTGKA